MESRWYGSFKVNALREFLYGMTHRSSDANAIFVVGCQRSGTTITARAVSLSPAVRCYGEGEKPYFYGTPDDSENLLRPTCEVKVLLEREKLPWVVLKPLCESASVESLLNLFPDSRAIWVYRHYEGAVSSLAKHFHHIDHQQFLRRMLAVDDESWLSRGYGNEEQELLRHYASRNPDPYTVYALFWLARNSLFKKVMNDARVILVNYQDLVRDPGRELRILHGFLDLKYRSAYASIIRENSSRPQYLGSIDEDVMTHCHAMYSFLEGCRSNLKTGIEAGAA